MERLAVFDVPEAEFTVPASRGEGLAVGRDRQRVDPVAMAFERPDHGTVVGLEQADDLVGPGRGESLAVGSERDREDRAAEAGDLANFLGLAVDGPDSDLVVGAGGEDGFAVG